MYVAEEEEEEQIVWKVLYDNFTAMAPSVNHVIERV